MKKKLMPQQAAAKAALMSINSETPFDKRHDCWFCGEPNQFVFSYDNAFDSQIRQHSSNGQLSLPCCKECYQVANQSVVRAKDAVQPYSIWTIKADVKQHLIHYHRKDLAIGINWTKSELEQSQFEQGNFAGFQRSAWFMFEIAKARVNYASWPLIVDGIELLDEYHQQSFIFDDVVYPNIEQAMLYYANLLTLSYDYFHSVLIILGKDQFAKAVRFCRLLVAANSSERQQALRQLRKEIT